MRREGGTRGEESTILMFVVFPSVVTSYTASAHPPVRPVFRNDLGNIGVIFLTISPRRFGQTWFLRTLGSLVEKLNLGNV